MSTLSISARQENDTNRRLSATSSEKIVYVDDTQYEISDELCPDYCQPSDNCYALYHSRDRAAFYPSNPDTANFQLDDHSTHCLSSSNDESRRNISSRSKTGEPKHAKIVSDVNQCSSRRSSVQSSRSRANSCSKPTALGNGRRGSTSRRPKSRRASTSRRKDSVRPLKPDGKEAEKIIEHARDSQQARRHRRIAMIVLGTFLFLLAASILVVVVTLTHSSFLSPAVGSKELAEHRAHLRRENEELLNSLNRVFVSENSTTPP